MSESKISLDSLNKFPPGEFCKHLEAVFEHSPWVIEAVARERPFASLKALQAACEKVLYGADEARQAALIRAHPDLAAKLDELARLTDFSQAEQRRAGFAALPPEELEALRTALGQYRERMEHPFILCVSEHEASDVLPILQVRCGAQPEAERLACLFQIARIGWHRICSLVSETPGSDAYER